MSGARRALVLAALLLAACAEPEEGLTVLAASSLTEALGTIEGDLERASPPLSLSSTFAGSQVLRLQIEQGAPADVFLSADEAHVDALLRAGLVVEPVLFAHNELVVIVPPSNPAGIESLEDLPRARRLVIGDASVPVGRYTRAMLARAGLADAVLPNVVSEESNVRLVRAKVELGEADAAVVYRTDAAGSPHLRVIPIPEASSVRADYHAAIVAASPRRALARRFLEHLTSEAGQRALEAHGLSPHR